MGKGQACDLRKDTYASSPGREDLNLWLFAATRTPITSMQARVPLNGGRRTLADEDECGRSVWVTPFNSV